VAGGARQFQLRAGALRLAASRTTGRGAPGSFIMPSCRTSPICRAIRSTRAASR
jgi:hypothetical protein